MFENISTSRIPSKVRFSNYDQKMIEIAFDELNSISPALFPEHLCNGKVQVLNNHNVRVIVENDNGKGFRFLISFKTPSMQEARFTTAYFKLKDGSGPASKRIVFDKSGEKLAEEIFFLLEEQGVTEFQFTSTLLAMEPGQLKCIIDSDAVRVNVQRMEDGQFFFTRRNYGKEWTPLMKSAVFSMVS